VQISSLKRIRFTGPVRPGEKFVLNLTHEDVGGERLFHFKVAVNENIVCSGLVAAANIIKDKKV
jgi:3-hydroxymyristoyl/3-hydroxydecanoyl-(acyl carrier protein) dehydratase